MTHAIILGIIQGLTEFLPVSSSAHLLIIPALLGWGDSGISFDVALHLGTFFAVFLYFFPIWRGLLVQGLVQRQKKEFQLLKLILIGTIPAAIIGLVGEKLIESTLRDPIIAAIMLIVFGILLYLAERFSLQRRSIETLSWRHALVIGLSQSLALIPGVSRSGITMTSGLTIGLTREEATRFSFLLLAPITFGAALAQMPQLINSPDKAPIVLGTIVSFVVGMAAIHFMLRFIRKYGYAPYVWYRVIAGIIFLILLIK